MFQNIINASIHISKSYQRINAESELFNSNVVKAVTASNQTALYFSREPIPHLRGVDRNRIAIHMNYFVNFFPKKLEQLFDQKSISSRSNEVYKN